MTVTKYEATLTFYDAVTEEIIGDSVPSAQVPRIGDRVAHGPGVWKVIDLMWQWPSPRSSAALAGDLGPLVDIMLVESVGMFRT